MAIKTRFVKNLDIDETEDQVLASGHLHGIYATNLTAAVVYLKLYDAVPGSVTVGTTTPVATFPVPTTGDTNGAGFVVNFADPVEFQSGLSVAGVTGVADSDTTGVAANGLVANFLVTGG